MWSYPAAVAVAVAGCWLWRLDAVDVTVLLKINAKLDFSSVFWPKSGTRNGFPVQNWPRDNVHPSAIPYYWPNVHHCKMLEMVLLSVIDRLMVGCLSNLSLIKKLAAARRTFALPSLCRNKYTITLSIAPFARHFSQLHFTIAHFACGIVLEHSGTV